MSYVAEQARALGMRMLSRRYDDPPHSIVSIDAAFEELAALRLVAVDSEDTQALDEVLGGFTEVRKRLDS
ncbi:MAG TPA: hypothetical protein VMU65_06485 [Candidatus Saccharimonadales bacterium]|jgi:hypothetical protein|nr:hypothetical protein [Candidatus Saccharimonadales bacterium]